MYLLLALPSVQIAFFVYKISIFYRVTLYLDIKIWVFYFEHIFLCYIFKIWIVCLQKWHFVCAFLLYVNSLCSLYSVIFNRVNASNGRNLPNCQYLWQLHNCLQIVQKLIWCRLKPWCRVLTIPKIMWWDSKSLWCCLGGEKWKIQL